MWPLTQVWLYIVSTYHMSFRYITHIMSFYHLFIMISSLIYTYIFISSHNNNYYITIYYQSCKLFTALHNNSVAFPVRGPISISLIGPGPKSDVDICWNEACILNDLIGQNVIEILDEMAAIFYICVQIDMFINLSCCIFTLMLLFNIVIRLCLYKNVTGL